jgi:Ca-activated chloride channel family protein
LTALRFAHPEWLVPLASVLLALLLALGLANVIARRRRALLLGKQGGRVAHRALTSDLALLLAAAAVAVALLGPRIGERVVRLPGSGVDVVFALDVSRSMDAVDVPPSRLARARRAVSELLARLEREDRVSLAAYAGVGVLLTPLTPDRDVLLELLSGVDTQLVIPGSSHLAAGVRSALDAFEAGSNRPRLLVVLSDGEDPQRHSDLAASEALRADVRVLAIAFGTEVGATVPDHGVALVDRWGRTVVSRRDLTQLTALASATDGRVFPADVWGQIDFDAAVREIRRDAGSTPGALVERRVSAVRVLPFAALAFGILLLEGLPLSRPRWRRAALQAVTASSVLLVAAPSPAGDAEPRSLTALEARVREQPDDPALLIALGAARLEHGQRDAAVRAFLAAAMRARKADAAAVAYFDLGVAQLERDDLEAARDAFFDALALDPHDEKARFNLEWTLIALERQPPSQPRPDPEARDPESQNPSPTAQEQEATEQQAQEKPPAREPLSEAQQRRLLERVEDDPGRALRSAARGARETGGSGDPVW